MEVGEYPSCHAHRLPPPQGAARRSEEPDRQRNDSPGPQMSLTPGDNQQAPDPWRPLVRFQVWVVAAIATFLIPSGLAAIGGVALNGGHALGGGLALAVDGVLVVSLLVGLGVLAVGFRRFLAAQAEARRRSVQRKSAQQDK